MGIHRAASKEHLRRYSGALGFSIEHAPDE
jgi:hypothetical protein